MDPFSSNVCLFLLLKMTMTRLYKLGLKGVTRVKPLKKKYVVDHYVTLLGIKMRADSQQMFMFYSKGDGD